MRDARRFDGDDPVNLFDLGGLPLTSGGTTAPRRVFRSGRPELLTDRGWSELVAAGVSTVIDLRNEAERGRRAGDPKVSDRSYSMVSFALCPTEDPDDVEFREVCGPWLERAYSYDEIERITERTEVLGAWLDGLDTASWLSNAGLSEGELHTARMRLLS